MIYARSFVHTISWLVHVILVVHLIEGSYENARNKISSFLIRSNVIDARNLNIVEASCDFFVLLSHLRERARSHNPFRQKKKKKTLCINMKSIGIFITRIIKSGSHRVRFLIIAAWGLAHEPHIAYADYGRRGAARSLLIDGTTVPRFHRI